MRWIRRFPLSVLISVLTTVLGVSINIATDGGGNVFTWGTVVFGTLLMGGLSTALERRNQPEPPPLPEIPATLGQLIGLPDIQEMDIRNLEIELRPDGTRIFRVERYSQKNNHDSAPERGPSP